MLQSKKITLGVILLLMVAMINMMIGCDSTTVESTDDPISNISKSSITTDAEYFLGSREETELILEDSPIKHAIITQTFAAKGALDGRSWLESQGYTFTEENSAIMIHKEYGYFADSMIMLPLDQPLGAKSSPEGIEIREEIIRADSIVWFAFENPNHDSSFHTAIITYWNEIGEQQTVFYEFDISTENPNVIREGYFDHGEFIPENMGLTNWLECVGAGSLASAGICAFMGPGYFQCLGAGAAASILGCTIYTVWQWFK